jgi:hypothetical protein
MARIRSINLPSYFRAITNTKPIPSPPPSLVVLSPERGAGESATISSCSGGSTEGPGSFRARREPTEMSRVAEEYRRRRLGVTKYRRSSVGLLSDWRGTTIDARTAVLRSGNKYRRSIPAFYPHRGVTITGRSKSLDHYPPLVSPPSSGRPDVLVQDVLIRSWAP